MDSKIFDEIENALDLYIQEDHSHPDMKVFSATFGFDPKDVAEVIRTSELLSLDKDKKDFLLNSFIKKPEMPAEPIPEKFREWSKRKRREIRESFTRSGLTVQAWLKENPNVHEYQLRNILDPKIWKERYEYAERNNWKELLKIFLEDVPHISVQQFCTEQGLSVEAFRNVCPKDVWEKRYEYKRRTIDWESEVKNMMASDLCLEDWAYQNKLSLVIFREKCGPEIVKKYDRNGRRASMFDPSLSMKENARKLGLSIQGLSSWVHSKLQEVDPEKFKAFKMDAKDYQIVDLQSLVNKLESEKLELVEKIKHLEKVLADKNALLAQRESSASFAKAKGEVLARSLEEALKKFRA